MMRAILTLFLLAAFASCNKGSSPAPAPSVYGKFTLGADTVYLNAGGTDVQAGSFNVRNQLNTATENWLVGFGARSRPTGTGSVAFRGSIATGITLVHSTPAGIDILTYFGLPTETAVLTYPYGRLRASFINLTETDETGMARGTRRLTGYVSEP